MDGDRSDRLDTDHVVSYELRAVRVTPLDDAQMIRLHEGVPIEEPGLLADQELTLDMLPSPESGEESLHRFALTTNGYERFGSNARCADMANAALERWRTSGELPTTMRDLRCCLFFEQRRWHHFGEGFDEETLRYVRELVHALGRVIESRDVASR